MWHSIYGRCHYRLLRLPWWMRSIDMSTVLVALSACPLAPLRDSTLARHSYCHHFVSFLSSFFFVFFLSFSNLHTHALPHLSSMFNQSSCRPSSRSLALFTSTKRHSTFTGSSLYRKTSRSGISSAIAVSGAPLLDGGRCRWLHDRPDPPAESPILVHPRNSSSWSIKNDNRIAASRSFLASSVNDSPTHCPRSTSAFIGSLFVWASWR